MAETEELVREHWLATERVAVALLTFERMDQAELDRLIGPRIATETLTTLIATAAAVAWRCWKQD